MFQYYLVFFYILFISSFANASIKEKIILNLDQTKNLKFNFKQTIDDKTESGICTIKYPKKIYCEYKNKNKKIMVSNGKSLVIKNRLNGISYFYPLKKTPLEYLLNKNYLITNIKKLKAREINNRYINFKLNQNSTEINIFFDKKSLNIIGWQTEDIYGNLVITFISSVKINQKIKNDLFKLPKM